MGRGKIIGVVLISCGALGVLSIAACAGVIYLGYRSANDSVAPEIDRLFASIDDGTFSETYETDTTAEFRSVTTKEQYADIGKAISTRLGRLQAKSLKGFNMRQVNADSLVDVTYDATFEKANGTIAARLKIQKGEWKLVSFRVTSPEFQKDVATAKCAKCGAPHARDARFCPACGNAIAHDKTSSEPLIDEATDK
jgi:hypothetical protein